MNPGDFSAKVTFAVLGPALLLLYPPIALIILTPVVILIKVGKQHSAKRGYAIAGFCITAAWWIFIVTIMMQCG